MSKERLLALYKGVASQYFIALYLVTSLTFCLIVSSFLLHPQEVRIAERTRQLSVEKQKVAVVESFILAHPDTDQYLAELQQSLTQSELALPGSLDTSKFIAQLEKDTRDSGIRLLNVKPTVVTDNKGGYREIPIEVSVEGQYFPTMAFLKKLEDGERFSLVSAFLMQQKQGLVATRLNLQIFCYGNAPQEGPSDTGSGQLAAPLPAQPKTQ
jgi:Tfp pilus assembly protein PilO